LPRDGGRVGQAGCGQVGDVAWLDLEALDVELAPVGARQAFGQGGELVEPVLEYFAGP
jgi:hypothetical protein